jgi:hypothetical protein
MAEEIRPVGWPIIAYCQREGCGHTSDWHKLDDALNFDVTFEDAPFRCVGYDSRAPGPPPASGRACDCPDMVRSQANLDALELQIQAAASAVRAAAALRRAEGRSL